MEPAAVRTFAAPGLARKTRALAECDALIAG
jgi:hypothetical protein